MDDLELSHLHSNMFEICMKIEEHMQFQTIQFTTATARFQWAQDK